MNSYFLLLLLALLPACGHVAIKPVDMTVDPNVAKEKDRQQEMEDANDAAKKNPQP